MEKRGILFNSNMFFSRMFYLTLQPDHRVDKRERKALHRKRKVRQNEPTLNHFFFTNLRKTEHCTSVLWLSN